uniref:DIX domain-containing protein n=1 Tax=Angiostrongylus cantonensis TaxID=6313 RepID=A0A0K0D317_ANGCA
LRRFTRYSHSMMEIPTSAPAPQPPLPPPPPPPSPSPPTSTAFSKKSVAIYTNEDEMPFALKVLS